MFALERILPVVLALAFLTQTGSAFAAPEVKWEVENRFRFYKTPATFKAYRDVASTTRTSGTGDWILNTERKLQQKYFDENSGSEKSWNGWASKSMDDTCWDRGGLVLVNEGRCEDYTLPGSHRVLVSVSGLDADAKCTVDINLLPSQSTGEFNQKRRTELFVQRQKEIKNQQTNVACRDIPVEAPFSAKGDAGVDVTVTVTQAGSSNPLPPVRIIVADLLVLGMGDSFGAGVGNPDLPSGLRRDGGIIYDDNDAILPVRKNGFTGGSLADIAGAQAKWLDIRCFRSQYGPQFRAALHLAVDVQHAAVTFLDLSCDGARIIEGLLHQKTLDAGFAPKTVAPESQLGRASRWLCTSTAARTVSYNLRFANEASQCPSPKANEICEFGVRKYQREHIASTSMNVCGATGADAFRRNIDLLLLSIGGNDIGFAPMVGNVLLGETDVSERMKAYLATEIGLIHTAETGKTRLGFLHAKYRVLDAAIDKYLPLRHGSSKPVFLTAYPLPSDDQNGATCGSSNAAAAAARAALDGNPSFDGFADPPSDALARLNHVINTSCLLNIRRLGWFNGGPDANAALAELTGAGKPCAGLASNSSDDPNKIDWQFEFAMLKKWEGHGFCAVKDGTEPGQSLAIPKGNPGMTAWSPPFDRMRPYASRQRWVRTPNDALAITNWQTVPGRIADWLNLLAATTTSAMHPSAEGYAGMADSLRSRVARYVCTERAGEFGGEPLCRSP